MNVTPKTIAEGIDEKIVKLMDNLRMAFDSDSVPVKNITLRKTYTSIALIRGDLAYLLERVSENSK